MVELPPEFWISLGQGADTLGVLGFLNGLVSYVGKRRAADEKATIEEYLELVRRQEHKEICELVRANAAAMDALRKFTEFLIHESEGRVVAVLQEHGGYLHEILEILKSHRAISSQPRLLVRVEKPLQAICVAQGKHVRMTISILNQEPATPVNIVDGQVNLIINDRIPFKWRPSGLKELNFVGGEAKPLMFSSEGPILQGDTVGFVSLAVKVLQDHNRQNRIYVQDSGDESVLVEYSSRPQIGARKKAKLIDRGPMPTKLWLIQPSALCDSDWVVRDESGVDFDIAADRLS